MRLFQLFNIFRIIPECLDKGMSQGWHADWAPGQVIPEDTQQAADAPKRKPGSNGAKGDVAEEEQG